MAILSASLFHSTWRCLSFFLLQHALLVCPAASIERVRIDAATGNFIGADGRTLLFHGVNVVEKKFPWYPSRGQFDAFSSLVSEDMANLKSWGFNAVRLGVMWPGVEPVMGQYNTTYLNVMREIIDELYSHGIFTIVDFHQDSFSEQWCGEGIPAWLLPMLTPLETTCTAGTIAWLAKLAQQCQPFSSFNIPIDPNTGFPDSKSCLERTFVAYSHTPELATAWGHFYTNEFVQDKFRAFWSTVASSFAGSPGVLGYDLINEPLNNFLDDPTQAQPGKADLEVFQPLYKALNDVIRAADPNAIIMYEPPPFPDTVPYFVPGLGGVHPVGFTSGPAGNDTTHQSLSYHIYSCGFSSECNRQGDTVKADCPDCDKMANEWVSTRDADRKRLGGGAFVTEFGACSGSQACITEINRVLAQAEWAGHSWAYWQFKYYHDVTTVSGPSEGFYKDDGTLQEAKVAALSRTYAPVVSGITRQRRYDPVRKSFRLKYDPIQYETKQPMVHLRTKVFLNKEMNYKHGFDVSVLNGTATDIGSNKLAVHAAAADLQVDVAITPTYIGPRHGKYEFGNQWVLWKVRDCDDDGPGFDFPQDSFGFKALYIYSDSNELVCKLTSDWWQANSLCDLAGAQKHDFLFNYRIEIWGEVLGVPVHDATIPFSYFGPLLKKRVQFYWVADSEVSATDIRIVV